MHDIQQREHQEKPGKEAEERNVLKVPARIKPRHYIMGGAIVVLLVIAALIFAPLLRMTFATRSQRVLAQNTPAQLTPLPTPIMSLTTDGDATQVTTVGGVAYVSTANRYVYALRTGDGRVLWHIRLGGVSYTSAEVVGNVLYIGADNGESQPGLFYALSANDGHVLWKYQDVGLFYSDNPVVDGTAYLVSAKELIALDASNGKVRWKYSPSEGSASAPVARDGIVYFGANWGNTGPSTLYALRASDGKVLWRYTSKNSVTPQMVQDGTVYAFAFTGVGPGSHSRILALSTSNGQQLWQQPFDESGVNAMQIVNGVAYLLLSKYVLEEATPSSQGSGTSSMLASTTWLENTLVPLKQTVPQKSSRTAVYAVSISDGKILWHYPLNNGKDGWAGLFTIDNGTIYTSVYTTTSASNGTVYALRAQDGTVLWHRQSSYTPSSGTESNGVIYLGTQDGMSAALRASDGKQLWSYPLSSAASYRPTLSGQTVYIGENNGLVVALDASNGKVRWHYQTDTNA